ncbi:MAG: hypothetical protein FWG56_09145 [Desulfovibrionaceae bacterium]|nr:hypothetical protein [Desulfovibrionaceae bacterium]
MKRTVGCLFYPCLLALSLCACVPVPKVEDPPAITGLDQTLKQAATGDAAAQTALGDSFRYLSDGLGKDEQASLRLYYAAADQGDAQAQSKLSRYFTSSTPDALMESAYWAYQRARRGNPFDMQRLASFYAKPDFPAYNLIESCKWRLLARQTCDPKTYSAEVIEQASQRAQPLREQFPVKP